MQGGREARIHGDREAGRSICRTIKFSKQLQKGTFGHVSNSPVFAGSGGKWRSGRGSSGGALRQQRRHLHLRQEREKGAIRRQERRHPTSPAQNQGKNERKTLQTPCESPPG